ncbi:MAG: alpha/beta fold hydrolase [Synechococcaceae cyanobacterium]|nr:alpha/beta fold hydrolase [Synechococcaceae cyanobacterium]
MASEAAGGPPASRLWHWRGHRIRWVHQGPDEDGTGPAVLLIHGFGASADHWRHNLPALARCADVYAIDLLGFGASDKPPSRLADEPDGAGAVRYCFDLWGEQTVDFVQALMPPEAPLHLVGNSIGGVVALRAARLLAERGRPPAQVVLIDCAQRRLDRKRLAELPAWQQLCRPLLQSLVRRRWLIAPLFQVLARPAMIRRVLAVAYPSGGRVDEELVALLRRPATDPGASESFRGFVNIFDDHLAPDLMEGLPLPVRMLWGERDPWEDPQEARLWAERYRCVKELRVLEGLGHCPHDEDPERVNPILLEWIGSPPPQCTCATT